MEIIPKSCLSLLPFAPEPISNWKNESDFLRFVSCLTGGPGHIVDWDEVDDELRAVLGYDESTSRTSDLDQFRYIVDRFQENAQASADPLPDFAGDENFGLMAKYLTVWDDLVSDVLAEAAFFSLAHLLECRSELGCSILLASHLYFRQALEILRSFLEETIVPLYFCDNRNEFDKWKQGDFRLPSLRGKNGMIKALVGRKLLPADLGVTLATLYGELNGSIHGAEKRLVHQGVFKGKRTGLIFMYDRFRDWCLYFARCVDFGIHALHLTIEYWSSVRPTDRVVCYVCHSDSGFDVQWQHGFISAASILNDSVSDSQRQPELTVVSFTCLRCGNSMAFDGDWVSQIGYSETQQG